MHGIERGAAHVPPGHGKSLWVLGERVTYKALHRNNAYTLFEDETAPQGGHSALVYYAQDVAFYVLQGEYAFTVDGRAVAAGPGSFLYVPMGIAHAYTNTSGTPGKMLVIVTPPGALEAFQEQVAGAGVDDDDALDRTSREERIAAIAQKHLIDFVARADGGADTVV